MPSLYALDARPGWRNWQTRGTQNPVGFGPCGFDPRSRHSHDMALAGEIAHPETAQRQRRDVDGPSGSGREHLRDHLAHDRAVLEPVTAEPRRDPQPVDGS